MKIYMPCSTNRSTKGLYCTSSCFCRFHTAARFYWCSVPLSADEGVGGAASGRDGGGGDDDDTWRPNDAAAKTIKNI